MNRIPIKLNAVAFFFLVYGLVCAAGTIVGVVSNPRGGLNLDLGILAVSVFFGLRRLSRGWRIFALVFCWLMFLSAGIGIVAGILSDEPLPVQWLGFRFASVPPIWVWGSSAAMLLLWVWPYRVLRAPDVAALFRREKPDAL